MQIELGHEIQSHQFNACDLEEEAEQLENQGKALECYKLCQERADGQYDRNAGELLFVPGLNRAGIFRGADSQWTDATSAQDALDRYNRDEMAN